MQKNRKLKGELMVKKNRKLFILLVYIIFASALLAGCGGGGNDTPSEPRSPENGLETESAQESDRTASGQSTSDPGASDPDAQEEVSAVSILDLFAKAKYIDGLYFESATTTGSERIDSVTWTQGNKIRNEIKLDGQIVISIIDADKGEFYTYMPAENRAMKFMLDDSIFSSFGKPTDYTDDIDPVQYRIVETITYQGSRCTVVIYTEGQEEVKMWVSEEFGMPLRIETMTRGVLISTVEYRNIQVGAIPSVFFTLPDGVEVIDFNTSMDLDDLSIFFD